MFFKKDDKKCKNNAMLLICGMLAAVGVIALANKSKELRKSKGGCLMNMIKSSDCCSGGGIFGEGA